MKARGAWGVKAEAGEFRWLSIVLEGEAELMGFSSRNQF